MKDQLKLSNNKQTNFETSRACKKTRFKNLFFFFKKTKNKKIKLKNNK